MKDRYETVQEQIRQKVCEVSLITNEALLASSAFDKSARRFLGEINSLQGMKVLLEYLKPHLF
ncbi:unnamed protein product [marine sediment metagenome]|uniref:Uncharacterized protein n=1 Tax=marine sediment metagenome TaxID=412755 RepID=X0VVE2_9ZZZZ